MARQAKITSRKMWLLMQQQLHATTSNRCPTSAVQAANIYIIHHPRVTLHPKGETTPAQPTNAVEEALG
jgi:hypothetical protein